MYGARAAGSRCPLGRWALRRRGCMSTCRLGIVFGASRCLFLERSRWRTEGRRGWQLCFARFKGLLKARFPLKKQLLLARRPSCAIA